MHAATLPRQPSFWLRSSCASRDSNLGQIPAKRQSAADAASHGPWETHSHTITAPDARHEPQPAGAGITLELAGGSDKPTLPPSPCSFSPDPRDPGIPSTT